MVGAELAAALEVRVRDAQGRPVPGAVVNFKVVKGGGSVFAGGANTNADGIAKERWTLGTSTADSQVVEVRAVDAVTGQALVLSRFIAKATAGPVKDVTAAAGNAQVAAPGSSLADSLTISAKDSYANPVSGVSVTWSVTDGGGTVAGGQTVTRADGTASAKWTLGSTVGAQHASATVGSVMGVTFSATAKTPDTSPYFLLGSVSGTALDYAGGKVLGDVSVSTGRLYLLKNLQTGATDTVARAGTGLSVAVYGAVTASGFVASAASASGAAAPAQLNILQGGVQSVIATASASIVSSAGDYVVYAGAEGPTVRRTLSTGAVVQVYSAAVQANSMEVASNGDVIYATSETTDRYRRLRNGVATPIPGPAPLGAVGPHTDGINIQTIWNPGVFAGRPQVSFVDGTTFTAQTVASSGYGDLSFHALAGGWSAYGSALGAGPINQVMTRSPAGVVRQVSSFTTDSRLEALAPDGSVVFRNSGDRYYAGPSSAPVKVGTATGTVYWRDNAFIVLDGGNVYKIVP